MKHKSNIFEAVVHGIFLILGLITVGCVLLITIYLIISGIPAIRQIGLLQFLFGKKWASTAAQPEYGILPFILTSVYGTAGAVILGVPIGFLTAVYLAKMAPKPVKRFMEQAVSMLAGIPSVVYGLVGMMVLVPGLRKLFHIPDGSSLFAAIIVLAVMILPSIIKMSVTALEADGASIPCAGIFILRQAVAPTDLLPQLETDGGTIRVDRTMATNLPGVFAAGDCTGGPLQVAKAVGEGHVAALSACAWLEEQK